MNKGGVFFLLALILLAVNPTEAQQAKKTPRIGYLSPLSGSSQTLEVFKEGLRELGWVEGKQVEFEYRYAGATLISFLSLRPNLFALKLTSSSRGLLSGRLGQRGMRRQQSLL